MEGDFMKRDVNALDQLLERRIKEHGYTGVAVCIRGPEGVTCRGVWQVRLRWFPCRLTGDRFRSPSLPLPPGRMTRGDVRLCIGRIFLHPLLWLLHKRFFSCMESVLGHLLGRR